MPTATVVIAQALRRIGVLRAGQLASVSQNNDGLIALNDMLDNWSTERTNIFNVATASFPLITTQQSYTIGAAGNFNTGRPVRIERAGILLTNPNGSGFLRQPLQLLSEREWDAISIKIETSPVPEKLYYDYAFPLGNLNFLPIPTWGSGTAPKVELSTWTVLTQFPDLTTSETFPNGYEQAIVYGLAGLLAPMWPKCIPDDEMAKVMDQAAKSLAAIRALNRAMEMEDKGMLAWQAMQPLNDPPAGSIDSLKAPRMAQ